MASPQLEHAHPRYERREASPLSRRALVLALILMQQTKPQFEGHLIFSDVPIAD
jgi:hypothetical protein